MSKLLNVQKICKSSANLPGVPVTQTIWSFFAALRVKAFLGSIYPSPVDTSEMVDPPFVSPPRIGTLKLSEALLISHALIG